MMIIIDIMIIVIIIIVIFIIIFINKIKADDIDSGDKMLYWLLSI